LRYSLYPPLTVRDNIAFALKSARMGSREVEKSVAEVARLLDIESILDRYPTSISGGQQQRASLARALLFVATFVGEPPMNVFESRILNGDRFRFAIDGGPTLDFADTYSRLYAVYRTIRGAMAPAWADLGRLRQEYAV
jgi:ABC-type sugar transport system ATPase subunit